MRDNFQRTQQQRGDDALEGRSPFSKEADRLDREGERRKRAFRHQKLMQGDTGWRCHCPGFLTRYHRHPVSNRREERMRKNSDVKFSFPSRPTDSEEILPGRGEVRRTRAVTSMARIFLFSRSLPLPSFSFSFFCFPRPR